MRMLRGIALALIWVVIASAVFAQQGGTPDYEAWERVASRVERAVEVGRASDREFEARRAEIVEWRAQFQSQINANASRIETLNQQIAALGPVPEEGGTEALEIATRRSELAEQLERLTTPRRAAEEAFSRADGIVAEIDATIRARAARQLLNAGPLPINPVLWPGALGDLGSTLLQMWHGVRAEIANPSSRRIAQDNLPLVILFVVIGAVLLVRSRDWSERLALRLVESGDRAAGQLAGFVVSLGQIALPVLGAFSLLLALRWTEFYGPRGDVVLQTAIPVAGTIFGARWLGTRIFPMSEGVRTPIGVPLEKRGRGRLYATALGTTVALHYFVDALAAFEGYALETRAVLNFPLVVAAGLLLMALGQKMRHHAPELLPGANVQAFKHQFIRLIGRATVILGAFGPLLGAAGYAEASYLCVFSTAFSLAIIAFVAVLQDVFRNVFALVMPGDEAGEGLIPTLIGFALVFLALPIIVLFWGVRLTDLLELWARLQEGISIGETTISPGAFLTLLVVFLVGYFLTRAVQASLRTTLLPKTRIDPGGQVAIVSGTGYVGIFLAAVVAITSAGLDLSNLAIVAGALSVGIGFGLQNIVSNFVSGIILLIERPISEGDWIEVGGQHGYVRNISVRSTRIETFDRTDVIVPNSDLVSGTVTNYTRGNTVGRAIVSVGVAYGTDTRRVEQILREISAEHPMVLANPAPTIYFSGFGASSLDFEIRAILRDVNFMLTVKNELHHRIAERFVEEGIEIPFPQQDLWLRNPDTLKS